ncbi:MAG: ferrous iron transporter B [Nanoarchaeota archaeon]|nr:ferrous iron transporter B [Nanoarchaeota archaeon]
MDCQHKVDRSAKCHEHCDIALYGNPNVGKSCFFNKVTKLGATVSNFPGTTVDIFHGDFESHGKKLSISDTPGIYSFDDTSQDVTVAKDYLTLAKPKVIINIVNELHLERSLSLTLELIKTKIPVVLALNFCSDAKKRKIQIDEAALEKALGIPVVTIDAINGTNVDEAILLATKKMSGKHGFILPVPNKENARQAEAIAKMVINGDSSPVTSISEKIDALTTHPVYGYAILFGVMALLFSSLFILGGNLGYLTNLIFMALIGTPLKVFIAANTSPFWTTVLTYGLVDGINAALQVAIPYIAVFYIMLSILEDSGYLPRMAYLMDKTFKRMGLHGKCMVPMMLGFGCSVPAIFATRILPSKRERVITAILINLIPCSARTAIILGAAGVFLGWQYALAIYALSLILMFIVGYILGRHLPGKSLELVIEMPEFRVPSIQNVLLKTWLRMKDFIFMATPFVVLGSAALGALTSLGLLSALAKPFEPIVSGWLMLPAVAGITLIYGILRKELALEMLILLGGSANLLQFMTPGQIFVFCLVATLYFPCLTTFVALRKEFGTKVGIFIGVSTTALAVIIGGIAGRMLVLLNLF